MAKVLVVDDEAGLREVLSTLMKTQKHEVETASDGEDALKLVEANTYDLMISDIRMSPMNGIDLLKKAIVLQPNMACVLVTAYSSVETAMEAMKFGAFDYVTKPFQVPVLLETIRKALEYGAAKRGMSESTRPEIRCYLDKIIAESEAMKSVCETVRRIAPTDVPVLLRGEKGAGRELIAHSIHSQGQRKSTPMVIVDCATIPVPEFEEKVFGKEGIVADASGGTVFFKNLKALDAETLKLLLELKSQKDIRVLVGYSSELLDDPATAAVIAELEAWKGSVAIDIPPLRDRREDILPIAFSILDEIVPEGDDWTIDCEARLIFETYDWPGNVRELDNAIRHALAFSADNCITRDALPPKLAKVPVEEEAKAMSARMAGMRGSQLKGYLTKMKDELISRQKKG